MILFETERLIVRRFTKNDADDFFRMNGDAELMKYIRPAKSREESDAFLEENIRLYGKTSIIGRFGVYLKIDKTFIGTFSFLYLKGDNDFHIGYALVKDAWKNGYATELVKNGIPYFFVKTNKEALYAITESANNSSQKVLQNAGFSPSGQVEEYGKLLDLFFLNREQFELTVAGNA